MAQESTGAGRDHKAHLKYGKEISAKNIFDLPQTFGVRAHRRHRWSKKVALVFELPDRTVETVLTLPAIQPINEMVAKYVCGYLWHILFLSVLQRWGIGILSPEDLGALQIPSPSFSPERGKEGFSLTEKSVFLIWLADSLRGDAATYDQRRAQLLRIRETLENNNVILRALRANGHDDNLIRLVALNAARHYKEADRKWVESERREEDLRLSKLKIGKPPQPPYGKELARDEQTGLRVYRRHWWSRRVTLVFELLDSEIAITPNLPSSYWAGKRLKINNVTEMLAAAGRDFKSACQPNSLLRCWRDAFLESGYGDESFRQVALQMAEKKPHVRGSAGDSTPKPDPNADAPPGAPKQRRDWLRRDWSLLLIQPAGAATAIYDSAYGTRYDNSYYENLYRLIICGLSAYTAYAAGASRRAGWAWLFGTLAAIYNPFFRVRMRTHDWVILDFLVSITFLASAWRIIFRDGPKIQKEIASETRVSP